VAGRVSPGIRVSSSNKTDRHDIAEILLKVALKTLTLTFCLFIWQYSNIEQHTVWGHII